MKICTERRGEMVAAYVRHSTIESFGDWQDQGEDITLRNSKSTETKECIMHSVMPAVLKITIFLNIYAHRES
jgi:hypothetical protein